MKKRQVIVINPGSTSTKIAVYQGEEVIFQKNIRHSVEELSRFSSIGDQYNFRRKVIFETLQSANIKLERVEAVMGRGGLIKPVESGVYEVNRQMIEDLKQGVQGEHASNLGGLIAHDIALQLPGAKAYIADPVVVDEMQAVAKIAGHPLFCRKSIFHALNQKAVARHFALSINKEYEQLNLIVAHMGGGISIGAHCKGKVIDVNNAIDGEGPFAPERSGSLTAKQLIEICFSEKYSQAEINKMINGKGGLYAYLETNNGLEVEKMAKKGENNARLIQDAMAYQTAKWIGAMATVLKGNIDGIIITGGLAYNKDITAYIIERVECIAPVTVFPGQNEMYALAQNACRVLEGNVEVKEYV